MADQSCKPESRKRVIFRPWRIDPKTGKKLWARNYGLRAWPIRIDDDE